jgi:hypothetical protein
MKEPQVHAYCRGIRELIKDGGIFFEQNQDHRGVGWASAQEIAAQYFASRIQLGGPPELPHGFANLWSMVVPFQAK